MKALGRHFILELSHCSSEVLCSLTKVREYIVEAAKRANAHVLKVTFHKFSPHGISGVVVIAESHLSIHTWPEEGYAAVDIYTCGDTTTPETACEYLAQMFEAKNVKLTVVNRGVKNGNGSFSHVVSNSSQLCLDSGQNLAEVPRRRHAVLRSA